VAHTCIAYTREASLPPWVIWPLPSLKFANKFSWFQTKKHFFFKFTEDVMYDFLSKYLLSEEDLVENGYPRPCPTTPGKAVFKTKKEQPSKDCKFPLLFILAGHLHTFFDLRNCNLFYIIIF